ncbi:MAG: hypothetical protein AAFV43_11780 [Planctomycetota bacterium]
MANAVEAGRAFMRLTINDQAFRRGLDRAARRLTSFGTTVAKVGGAITGFGTALLSPLALVVRTAADAQETFSKFDTVFASNAAAVRAWGDNLAQQVGRSEADIAGFVAGFQDLLVPIGIDPAVAQESSKTLTQLAIDLASFNNQADSDSVRDLQAALTGSSEVMKKYGVIVNQTAVNQELLRQGLKPKDASEQEKVFARLAIILAGTTAAQGDAIRTGDQFTNSFKALRGAVTDAAVAIGGPLLRPLASVIQRLKDGVKLVTDFARENEGAVRVYAAVGVGIVALGGVITGLGLGLATAGLAISGFSALLGVVGTVAATLTSPFALIVGGVTGVTAAFLHLSGTGGRVIQFLSDQFGPLLGTVTSTMAGIRDAIAGGNLELAGRVAMAGLRTAWAQGVQKIGAVWTGLQSGLIEAQTVASRVLIQAAGGIADGFVSAWGFVRKSWASLQAFIAGGVLRLQKIVAEFLGGDSFDIQGQLDKLEQDLNRTTSNVDRATDAARKKVEQFGAAAIDSLEAKQAQRQAQLTERVRQTAEEVGRLNDELKRVNSEAAETRLEATERGAADDPRQLYGPNGEELLNRGLQNAVRSVGTFSSQAASLVFGQQGSALEGLSRAQLDRLERIERLLARGIRQPRGIAVV